MKMKNILLSALAIATAAALTGPAFAQTYKMSIAHLQNPDPSTSGVEAGLRYFKSFVERATDGDIEVTIYASGQLGSEVDTAAALKKGKLVQSTSISSGAMSSFMKNYQLMTTPFLYKNEIVADQFLASEWFTEFMRDTLDNGMRFIGSFSDGGGFVNFTNNKHLIKTIDDLKGLNIRTEENPAHMEIVGSLGASATPLPWAEVASALSSGLADGQFNALGVIVNFKLAAVTDYMTDAGLLYNTTPWLVSEAWFSELPENYKQIIISGAREATRVGRAVDAQIVARDWAAACEEFKECYTMPQGERDKLKEAALPKFKTWVVQELKIPEDVANEFWGQVDELNAAYDEQNAASLR